MSLVLDGTAGMTAPQGAVYNGIQSGTAVASTSGTSITFTGIPSWVKRVTVMFNGVSTSGTSLVQVQVGSGSVTTTGYFSAVSRNGGNSSSTTGILATAITSATDNLSGVMSLSLISANTWCAFVGTGVSSNATGSGGGGVSPSLSGALDRVVITTVNGTDTFDAGSINILYE